MGNFFSFTGKVLCGVVFIVAAPVIIVGYCGGKALEKMGMDNPKRDKLNGYDPSDPSSTIY